MVNLTMKGRILSILSDGLWHGCSHFVHLGLSYRNRINELKREGEFIKKWSIESKRENGGPTYRYRMIPFKSKAPNLESGKSANEVDKEISEEKEKNLTLC